MNFGYSVFTRDYRIITLDIWSGKLYEHSIDGRLIYTYPVSDELTLCPQRALTYDELDTLLISSCSSYYLEATPIGIIKSKNIFLAMRNVTNPPVFLDFWDIAKRKFLGSINIGNATLFAVHDSSIWLTDSVVEGKLFLSSYILNHAPDKDTLENLAEICILDLVDMKTKSLAIFIPQLCKDTVAVINSFQSDCLGRFLESKVKNRFTTIRMITEQSRERLISLKNSSNFFHPTESNVVYNINLKTFELPYLILASSDGTVIKTYTFKEAESVLEN